MSSQTSTVKLHDTNSSIATSTPRISQEGTTNSLQDGTKVFERGLLQLPCLQEIADHTDQVRPWLS